MFIKRRAKLLRNHWRNGIAGLDNPGSAGNADPVAEYS